MTPSPSLETSCLARYNNIGMRKHTIPSPLSLSLTHTHHNFRFAKMRKKKCFVTFFFPLLLFLLLLCRLPQTPPVKVRGLDTSTLKRKKLPKRQLKWSTTNLWLERKCKFLELFFFCGIASIQLICDGWLAMLESLSDELTESWML